VIDHLQQESKSTKTCSVCGLDKFVPNDFTRDSRNRDGLVAACKSCESKRVCDWQADNPEQHLGKRRHAAYHVDFNALWEKQEGKCAMCGTLMLPRGQSPMSVTIDHDQNCCPGYGSCGKCVRGLIHNRCNRVLGNAKDDVPLLKAAIAYLERWRDGLQ
jgi:hypothetical protein